jgi:hypothetical protein
MAGGLPQDWAFLIFEALQKTAEVIARGRVSLLETQHAGLAQSTAQQPRRPRVSWPLYPPAPTEAVVGAPRRRLMSRMPHLVYAAYPTQLNLEVEEVPSVRQRLRAWRDNLYTPLVLDINFEERDGTGVLRHKVRRLSICSSTGCVPAI